MKRMRRWISLLLTMAMILSAVPAFPLIARAAGSGASVLTYEDYTYTVLEDQTIAICGYYGQVEEPENMHLVIPTQIGEMPVTQIAPEAFAGNQDMDTVVIPAGIQVIGDAAFAGCSDLQAVLFQGEIPELGETLLQGCTALSQIYVLETADLTWLLEVLEKDLEEAVSDISVEILEDTAALDATYSGLLARLDAQPEEVEPSLPTETEAIEEVTESDMTEPPAINLDAASVSQAAPLAAETVEEGSCGENLTWTLDAAGVLTINGTGAMTDFSQYTAPWYSHRDSITSVSLAVAWKELAVMPSISVRPSPSPLCCRTVLSALEITRFKAARAFPESYCPEICGKLENMHLTAVLACLEP